MSAHPSLAAALGLAVALAACGGPVPAPPEAPKPPAVAAPEPGAPDAAPLAALPVRPEAVGPEIPKYQARGRRDPFEPLGVREGVRSPVASARLTGIVRSDRTTLALVETPEGIGYILRLGDTLGDGRLLEIGSDSVVFQVTLKQGAPTNRVVLRLATN